MRIPGIGRLSAWGALGAGLLAALLAFFPGARDDSRMALEAVFAEAPAIEEPGQTVFQLRYDRGRGLHGLRVVRPGEAAAGEAGRFRWVFDDRPMRALRIDARPWAGSFVLEEAFLTDREGRELHRFDLSLAEYGQDPGGGRWAVLPIADPGGVPGIFRVSQETLAATLFAFLVTGAVAWLALQLAAPREGASLGNRLRHPYGPAVEPDPARRVLLPSLLVLAAVVLARSWTNFLHPSLFVEDAFHYFNRYYGNRIPLADALLAQPNGYLNVLPNFAAWLLAYLPPRWIAGAYAGVAVAASLCAAILPAKTGLFRNSWILFTVPLVLGLSGLNHVFYFTTITFLMYVVVLILLVLLLQPPPATRMRLCLRTLAGVVLVFSGPYSVVAVPAAFLLLLQFRPSRQSWFWAAMAITGLLYMQTTQGVANPANLFYPPVLERAAEVLVGRVLFLDLLPVGPVPGGILAAAFLGGLAWTLRGDPFFLRMGLVLLAVSLLSLAPLFLSLKFFLYPDPYACHIVIAQFFWILLLLFAADRLLLRCGRGAIVAPVVAAAFLALVAVDNRLHPEKRFFPPNPAVREFLGRVEAAEAAGLEERNEFILIRGEGALQEAFIPQVRVGSGRPDADEVQIPTASQPAVPAEP